MFFATDPAPRQPDALDEVLAVSEDLDVIMAIRYAAIDRMREELFGAFDDPTGTGAEVVRRSVRLELAAALRITEHAAEVLIDTAEGLVHRFPDALDALAQGRVTDQHARVMVARLAPLDVDVQISLGDGALELAERYAVECSGESSMR